MSSIQKPQIKYLGVDTGGTFTDFVLYDGQNWSIHKVLSTPDNPAKAILTGIDELGLQENLEKKTLYIVHGSTVATNAALERKGAKTVYIANKGFKDLLSIGRQARQGLYDLKPDLVQPPVPENLCLEIDTRRDAKGDLIEALTPAKLDKLKKQIDALAPESVAINLLFSFLHDEEEKAIEAMCEGHYFTSRSSFVLPKYKEYERGIATWLNASLGPKVDTYMRDLKSGVKGCPVSVMQSSGGTLAIDQAAKRAVNLLLSGPAGGLAAIRKIGEQCSQNKIISFDMGGTSTDVALMDGDFTLTDEGQIDNWPVAVPMLNIETIGAGGGSIAWVDGGGMLHVGPQSAGSDPGPACYGKGGIEPCVSDANVVLGRLLPSAFLGGKMQLDKGKSIEVVRELAQKLDLDTSDTALGIVRVAEHQMMQALHRISVKRGHDPRDFTLCCFGGAGGLHVCSLAEQLQMQHAIVPRNSGVLSAMGMLAAPIKRRRTQTFISLWEDLNSESLEHSFVRMESEALESMRRENLALEDVSVQRSLDMRYQGQSYTLNVALSESSDDYFR